MTSMEPTRTSSERLIKTLLLTDLVGSTALIEGLGDYRASQVFERFDRIARDLLAAHDGLEIDRTDGFLFLFDRPISAVLYALAFHDELRGLSSDLGLSITARVGIHLGEVVLRRNPAEHVERGAKPLEIEGLAKPVAARVMSLGAGNQTLMTRSSFDLARRASKELAERFEGVSWVDHGLYEFHGVQEPQSVSEVGRIGESPLAPPPDSEKAWRIGSARIAVTTDWAPCPGQAVEGRPQWSLERKLADGPPGQLWLAGKLLDSAAEVTLSLSVDEHSLAGRDQRVFLFELRPPAGGGRAKWTVCDPISCVLVASGDQEGEFVVLGDGVLSAGRDIANDLHLNDPKVSRAHFEIHRQADGYLIRALPSKNGVYLNRVQIDNEQNLQNGDEIRVGRTELVFYEDPGGT